MKLNQQVKKEDFSSLSSIQPLPSSGASATGRLPDLNEPAPLMDVKEEFEANSDAAQAPHKMSKASLASSISKFENFLRIEQEKQRLLVQGGFPPLLLHTGRFCMGGCWNTIVQTLESYGKEGDITEHHTKWRAALQKIVPKEGTDCCYLRNLKEELDKKGRESDFFKEVVTR